MHKIHKYVLLIIPVSSLTVERLLFLHRFFIYLHTHRVITTGRPTRRNHFEAREGKKESAGRRKRAAGMKGLGQSAIGIRTKREVDERQYRFTAARVYTNPVNASDRERIIEQRNTGLVLPRSVPSSKTDGRIARASPEVYFRILKTKSALCSIRNRPIGSRTLAETGELERLPVFFVIFFFCFSLFVEGDVVR